MADRELKEVQSHNTYYSIGLGAPVPEGYTKIPVHFVFDAKESGRHKGRIMANGSKMPIPVDPVYSSVAALCSLCICMLLGELNGPKLLAGDISNAYLQSYTKEKVAFVAGKEFGPKLAGHTMIVDKALYGLQSLGL